MSGQLFAIKEKLDAYGDHFKISATVRAINIACEDENNSGILIGHSKALIESIAKSILDEKNQSYGDSVSVNNLVKNAISTLGIAQNVENSTKAKSAFSKLLSSVVTQFETATSCYAELRNDFCPMAHGKSSSHIPLDFSHALMVVRHVDAMVAFILELYYNNPNQSTQTEADEHPEQKQMFNDFLDDEFNGSEIFGDIYLPHEILENLNPDKYKDTFNDFFTDKQG